MVLTVGDSRKREQVRQDLLDLGYRQTGEVSARGEFAFRGNILDVFPREALYPGRLEFLGSRLVSIRIFDPVTQSSLARQGSLALERFHSSAEGDGAGRALGGWAWHDLATFRVQDVLEEAPVLLLNQNALEAERSRYLDDFGRTRGRRLADRHAEGLPEVAALFLDPLSGLRGWDVTDLADPRLEDPELVVRDLSVSRLSGMEIQSIEEDLHQGWELVVCVQSPEEAHRLDGLFSRSVLRHTALPLSFRSGLTRTFYLTYREYHYAPTGEVALDQLARTEDLLEQMNPGDLVVHREHGVGRLVGFEILNMGQDRVEFLKLEYQNQEYLYIPVHEVHILRPFPHQPDGGPPALDRMGGTTWKQKTTRAKKAMVTFARGLLDLYARRRAIAGTAFPREEEWEHRLEQSFGYVETPDQTRAIREVMGDLESPWPMDRLICGDVSFGKTEVAIRAALRVLASGYQVAVLCPTTLLAHQHHQTFIRRLEGLSVRVGLLSRLVPADRQRQVHSDLAEGRMDLVIGTHALLGKKIAYKRLGLMIVDEEQRFGVFQKEKLKEGREALDVLTLSATPIPRTLSMSLAGLQDISVIRTPPLGRQEIRNHVGRFTPDILITALRREAARKGQAFVVFNNVEQIYDFTGQLRTWMPEITFGVVHAQMSGTAIEAVLIPFLQGEIQVLVATTIIENGIDIPAVNTMVVMDADRFGLTQLYQLRGRIGRGTERAHAYFLVRHTDVGELAEKRLAVIREFTALGSGYRIAEHDLRLRGAGSLLGNRQHGHVEALGFDYYMEMLERTVKELKGDTAAEEEVEIPFTVRFHTAIPSEYISQAPERLRVYRSFLEARDVDELIRVRTEVEDRYGQFHPSLEKVFMVASLRVMARMYRFASVEVDRDQILLGLNPAIHEDAGPLRTLLALLQVRVVDPRTVAVSYQRPDDLVRPWLQHEQGRLRGGEG